jgi:hypothetical protein
MRSLGPRQVELLNAFLGRTLQGVESQPAVSGLGDGAPPTTEPGMLRAVRPARLLPGAYHFGAGVQEFLFRDFRAGQLGQQTSGRRGRGRLVQVRE